jgi:lipid-binding SYLF domain-containing protein
MRLFGLFLLVAFAGCGSTKPESTANADTLNADCDAAITRFKSRDSTIAGWFDKAHGYAIFPSVGKAGLFVGGAHGKGQVYEAKKQIGYSMVTQGTIGLQIGAQVFSEVIFFKDKTALDAFKEGNWEAGAQATAVAVKQGASADADYSEGVKIFTLIDGGLMAEAAVGGQKFSYEPK